MLRYVYPLRARNSKTMTRRKTEIDVNVYSGWARNRCDNFHFKNSKITVRVKVAQCSRRVRRRTAVDNVGT